ncbi:10207_t:CDS:2, partial [Scutellospora calospora]
TLSTVPSFSPEIREIRHEIPSLITSHTNLTFPTSPHTNSTFPTSPHTNSTFPTSLHTNSTFPTSSHTNSTTSSHTNLTFPTSSKTLPLPTNINNVKTLETWITKFETHSIISRRTCAKFSIEFREDSKCFPFLGCFVPIFESINQLGRNNIITSKECLDFALREELLLTQPIVLHESLDEPLTILLKEILLPIEKKHLCDYLWAPKDEFEEYERIMSEISLIEGSRVSQLEHMIVGEKMAK